MSQKRVQVVMTGAVTIAMLVWFHATIAQWSIMAALIGLIWFKSS